MFNNRGRGGNRNMPYPPQGHQLNMPNHNMMPNLPPEHMIDPNFEAMKIGNRKRKIIKPQPQIIPKCASDCLRELCPDYSVTLKDGNNGKPFFAITNIQVPNSPVLSPGSTPIP